MPNGAGDATADAPSPERESSRLHIGWIMPPFVHELPVNAVDDEAAADQLYALATELLPHHPPEYQYRFALGLSAQLEPMAAANVIYAGLCPLEVEGRPSLSTIVVSQLEHDSTDEAELLRQTRELLERKYPDDDCQAVELTCGPALTRIGTSRFVVDAEWSASGEELPAVLTQMQAYIPLPGTAEMLVMELSSQAGETWGLHAEVFSAILNTVDWGTDQEVEDYRAMQGGGSADMLALVEPDESVKKNLYWHSSRLVDAVALRGRVGGGEVASLTCAECWAKGLRSACSARHTWYIGEVRSSDLTCALPRVVEAFASQGWRTDDASTGERVELRAGNETPERSVGHAFTAAVDVKAGRFTAAVTTPCSRASAPGDSLFG
ncbi:hypothetical protein [Streptomyces paromomycinus]|uniref:Uncharacterized protein n=1 Tax=Streptomyces paromomycinus TaxID=92743 RepID=A0A401VYJ7_STREY|nr:hypothetical protein [Streptomyces paromomycinus]GCD42137.1 hypothetical protein GKJPGBOP_01795 [Streptomyces paromomycinus]